MFKIGDKVRVQKLADISQDGTADFVGKVGVLRAYRIVDGSGVGCLVDFGSSEESVWFFEKELVSA
ncbi:MAG: cytochrome b6f subunit family protein [Cyanobacteria bacterium J06639_1]